MSTAATQHAGGAPQLPEHTRKRLGQQIAHALRDTVEQPLPPLLEQLAQQADAVLLTSERSSKA